MNTATEMDESGKWLVMLGDQGSVYARIIRALQRLDATPITGNVWLVHQDHYENAEQLRAELSKLAGVEATKMIWTWCYTNAPDWAGQLGYEVEFKGQSEGKAINLRGRRA